MVFDGYFNESLSMILASEKKKRNEIEVFIESFPFELYDKLNYALSLFDEYERENIDVLNRDACDISEKIYLSNNYMYWFYVDMISGSLNIGRSFNGLNDIEITLYSSNAYDTDYYRNLGFINYGQENIVCYEYLNTIFGKMVISSRNGRRKKYTKINDNIFSQNESKKHNRVRRKI